MSRPPQRALLDPTILRPAVLESLRGRFDVSRSMLASARASREERGLRHGLAQTELYAGMVELIAGTTPDSKHAQMIAEGKGGINNRIQAWRIKNPSLAPSNFKIILDNFDLMKASNVDELAKAIIAAQMHEGVILIDTLNQASPAADENSSQDMGIIIKHLKLLQEITGGLVVIIHHTGKNTSQGLRGHSSLKAALDANIEVVGGDKRSWLLEKSKDGEDGKNFGFRLEVQRLGIDSDGDLITSCTVERDHSTIFTKPDLCMLIGN
jgi:hypothetical protein